MDSEATGILLHDIGAQVGTGLWFHGVADGFAREYAEWSDRNVFLRALPPQLRSGDVIPNAPGSRRRGLGAWLCMRI